jgi:hypothetical protein
MLFDFFELFVINDVDAWQVQAIEVCRDQRNWASRPTLQTISKVRYSRSRIFVWPIARPFGVRFAGRGQDDPGECGRCDRDGKGDPLPESPAQRNFVPWVPRRRPQDQNDRKVDRD